MTTTFVPVPVARDSADAVQPLRRPTLASDAQASAWDFSTLLRAFQATGGTARGDHLARLLQGNLRGDYVSLARLMASGSIFGFEWRQTLWIPMFQFDPRDLSVKSGTRQVLAELAEVFVGGNSRNGSCKATAGWKTGAPSMRWTSTCTAF